MEDSHKLPTFNTFINEKKINEVDKIDQAAMTAIYKKEAKKEPEEGDWFEQWVFKNGKWVDDPRAYEAKMVSEKGGTEPDNKDAKRIDDLVKKGGGDAESDKSLALSSQMAKSIKDGEKAYRRGVAAKEMGYKKISDIFFSKASELGVTE